MKAATVVFLCIAFAIAGAAPLHAQDYPTHSIRAPTATSAGGTSDVFLRVIGEEMRKHWGQPIIVENRPGGAMNVGGHACADAGEGARHARFFLPFCCM